AKIGFARELTEFARTVAPAELRAEAARRVAELCPQDAPGREEHQERQRSARLGAVRPDGTSALSMVLTPRARALVERALCDFGRPGGTVACEPGADDRTPEQRSHDALVQQWALGSTIDPARPKGIATIVVRMTPEQLEDPTTLVRTDSGTQVSVRQAVSMAGTMPWFVSVLREGREKLHRIDVDAHPERRLASALQRLVLYAAHGGCTFPGCDAPARGCQFHHVRAWSDGGPTTVANGGLGCPVHHGFVGGTPASWKTVINPVAPGRCLWIPPGVDRLTDACAAQSHRTGASVPPRGEVPRVETGRRWNNAGVPDSTESDTSASDTSTTDAAASDATASALVTSPRPTGDPRLPSAAYAAAPEGA